MMINGDPEGRIFLSQPHTNNGLFFLAHHLKKPTFSCLSRLPEVPEYVEMENALHYEDLIIICQTNLHPYAAVILGMVCVSYIPTSTDAGVPRTAHMCVCVCACVRACV